MRLFAEIYWGCFPSDVQRVISDLYDNGLRLRLRRFMQWFFFREALLVPCEMPCLWVLWIFVCVGRFGEGRGEDGVACRHAIWQCSQGDINELSDPMLQVVLL